MECYDLVLILICEQDLWCQWMYLFNWNILPG